LHGTDALPAFIISSEQVIDQEDQKRTTSNPIDKDLPRVTIRIGH
jgi:hypothetical protein